MILCGQKPIHMAVLAPPGATIPKAFTNVFRNATEHERLLGTMQQMRGRVALRERAINKSDLDRYGRHRMPKDEDSWHLLRLAEDGSVNGCARILVHPSTATFTELRLASSAVAQHPYWGKQVRWTVESDLAMAQDQRLNVVEPGGWVLEEKLRGTSEAISIALSAFAWARLIGNCLAYITATVKHGSSSMLRRLGAHSLYFGGEEIPKYYDGRYQCDMELLKLQTPWAGRRFEARLALLHHLLSAAPVVQADAPLSSVNIGKWTPGHIPARRRQAVTGHDAG